jgi:hypothetical protein
MSTICPTLIQSYDDISIYHKGYPEFHVLPWQYTGCEKIETTNRGDKHSVVVVITISNICDDVIKNDVLMTP